MLPLYTPAMIDKYQRRGDADLEPHPYIIGDNCYKNLWIEDAMNQSILVSYVFTLNFSFFLRIF